MAKYTGTILTNKGKDLLARAILGETIVFTKVEIGKGIVPLGIDKETLTSLVDSFKTLSITSSTVLPNGGYRIRISFNNKGFVQDTYLREIGVYARGEDGIEILYSYCNTDTPNLIPNEPSGKIEIVEDIITYVSSVATINAVVDQSNIYATIKDLTEGLATKENKFNKNNAFNKKFGTISGTVMEGSKRATDLGGEAAFNKNDGFNKKKSDLINLNDSNTIATSKAVKIAYDRGSSGVTKADNAQNSANGAQTKANQAYTLADAKEPKFTKKSGFNKDKSDSVTTDSSIILATAKAIKTVWDALTTHRNSTNNPHATTKSQLGLGNVPNFSITDSVGDSSSSKFASAKGVKTAYDRGNLGITKASTAQSKADSAYALAIACPHGVGDYWITESTSNPATRWTGTTWTKVEGRVLLGTSSGYAIGSQSGKSSISLALANMALHSHGFSGTTSTKGDHYHQGGNHRHKVDDHTHSIGTYNAFGSFEIKRDEDNVTIVNGSTGVFSQNQTGANRNHSMSSNDGRYRVSDKVSLNTKDGDSGTLGVSSPYTNYQNPNTSATGNHNHTVSGNTGSVGSGSAFNIMNPYRVVNIWRRTA